MTAKPTKPKPRRRLWQFSLRTFFVLLTVFAVSLVWKAHRVTEQRKVVTWVREMGGYAYYDFQVASPFHYPSFSLVLLPYRSILERGE